MNEQQLAAVKQALEALEAHADIGIKSDKAITALQSIISQDALDKKAENARELGLSYDDEPKIGCVNHDCDKCKAVQEGRDWSLLEATQESLREHMAEIKRLRKALPPMHSSGLVAIKTLLSRDPCTHAKVAIEMIDEMLKENI